MKPQKFFLWVLWYSLFSACIGYPFMLGAGWPSGSNAEGSLPLYLYVLGYGSMSFSILIRWFIIPKFQKFEQLLIFAILGMAIAEAIVFYGVFLVDDTFAATRRQFYIMGIFGVGQYIPIYTRNITNL